MSTCALARIGPIAALLLAIASCAPKLPSDWPLKQFYLPKGSKLVKAEKSEAQGGPPGMPAETRWTVQFESAQEWPKVAAHFTEVLLDGSGLLPEPGLGLLDPAGGSMSFFSPDRRLIVSLNALGQGGPDGPDDKSMVYEMTVMQTPQL